MAFVLTEAKKKFFESEEALWATEELQRMVDDAQYNTPDKTSYALPNTEPVSFVEWNLMYLCEHQAIGAQNYLSNLRLKTKIRSHGRVV